MAERPHQMMYSQRLPRELHAQATELARARGSNLTAYVVRAVREAVQRDSALKPPEPTGDVVQFALTLHYQLPNDGTATERTGRLLDQTHGLACFVGATHITGYAYEMRTVHSIPHEGEQ